MKTAVALLGLVVALAAAAAAPADDDKYSSRFDHVDVDAILNNDRLFENYVKCMLSQGDAGCTAEGKALKDILSEALATDCAKCTDTQKKTMDKVLPFIRTKKPDAWKQLGAKYDPNGEWVRRHP